MEIPEHIDAPRDVALTTSEERERYAAQVWQLIVKTYEGYGNSEDGNLYGAEMRNLIDSPGVWRLVVRGESIIAGVLYRHFKGNKVRLVLHDDTRAGKDAMKNVFLGEFSRGNCWGEFSGNLERILTTAGIPGIPNTEAARILEKEIQSLDPDGLHYEREVFPGTVKREMLFGTVA